MLQKGYENLSPYFSPRNKDNHYRLLLCASILASTVFKSLLVKSSIDSYRDAPNELLKEGKQGAFYQAAIFGIMSASAWILLEFLSVQLKNELSKSLRTDISKDIVANLKVPKVNVLLRNKYTNVAESLPTLLVDGVAEYSGAAVNSSLGLVTQTVDFLSAVSAFHARANSFVCIVCLTTTAIMSYGSFYLTQGSGELAKNKTDKVLEARKQLHFIIGNSQQLASLKAEDIEVDILADKLGKVNNVLARSSGFEVRNHHLNWWMSESSSRILAIVMAPLIFANQASLQTDFFALNRELYQIRNFSVWFCHLVNSGNFLLLNDCLFEARTALSKCLHLVNNSELRFEFGDILSIKKLRLFSVDGSKKLLSIDDPVDFQTGVYLLTGDNGAGKSTFLNALSGISFEGTNGALSTIDYQQQVHIPQNVAHKDGTSLLDLILYPRKIEDLKPRTPREIRDEIAALLDQFELKKLSDDLDQVKNWSTELSGGEKQIISLIQAFVARPKLLLLDEVTSAMSEDNKLKAKNEIKRFSEKNKAVVIHIEHGARNNSEYYTHEIKLAGGRMEVIDLQQSKGIRL
jgi:ABC-type uncharacterized transport system fused permease/ATPase subunit